MLPRWDDWLGSNLTSRLQRRILPRLRWNQEIWGETIRQYLTQPVRWLDAGCGWRSLGHHCSIFFRSVAYSARMYTARMPCFS
jgi:hypothetical protein